jgi:hypothetical protein
LGHILLISLPDQEAEERVSVRACFDQQAQMICQRISSNIIHLKAFRILSENSILQEPSSGIRTRWFQPGTTVNNPNCRAEECGDRQAGSEKD